ncbi:hypothetical protein DEF98_018770, partial [Xanthomonas vasicola]
ACNPGNTPQTCRNRQKIGDLSALSAADAVASFSGRVDQTIPKFDTSFTKYDGIEHAYQQPT